MPLPPWSGAAALGAAGSALIIWNLTHGARLSTLASSGRVLRILSGVSAFLLIPALVVGALAPTAFGARVLQPLAWLWPAVTVAYAIHGAVALQRGRASILVTIPIVAFDVLVAWVATTRWIALNGAALPAWALAPGVAVASLATVALGDGAYAWSGALLVPALAPAVPGRWRVSAAWRAMLAAIGSVIVVMVVLESSTAFGSVRAAHALANGAAAERPRTDYAIGLRLFGTLTGPPAGAVARHDIALADSLGVTIEQVDLAPAALAPFALDSLARTVESRADSVTLIVTLTFDADSTELTRVMRRLRPDVLVPPPAGGRDAEGETLRRLERTVRVARRVSRDVTVAFATRAESATDSALVDRMHSRETAVDGLVLFAPPGPGNPARYEAALAALARWARLHRTPLDTWLLGVPAAPAVEGVLAQQHLVRYAIRWGNTHPWVRGVVVGDASDGWSARGVRSASGQSRAALAEIGAALRALRDVMPLPAVDATGADSLRAAPDTLPQPRP